MSTQVFELVKTQLNLGKQYALHVAACKDDLHLVRFLIAKGADLRQICEPHTNPRVSFSLRDEKSSGQLVEEPDGDDGEVNSQIASVPLPNEKYAMGYAAKHGYFDVLKELVLNCWQFTDLDTSVAAGQALDYAFHIALRDQKFDQAIDLMVVCWHRNDLKYRKQRYVVTIYYALSVVRAVRKHVRQEQVRRLP